MLELYLKRLYVIYLNYRNIRRVYVILENLNKQSLVVLFVFTSFLSLVTHPPTLLCNRTVGQISHLIKHLLVPI